jgi:hypothetical protein
VDSLVDVLDTPIYINISKSSELGFEADSHLPYSERAINILRRLEDQCTGIVEIFEV